MLTVSKAYEAGRELKPVPTVQAMSRKCFMERKISSYYSPFSTSTVTNGM